MLELLLTLSMVPRIFNPNPSLTIAPGPCTQEQHRLCAANCFEQKRSDELLADVTCRLRSPFDLIPDCTCHVMSLIPDIPTVPEPDPVAY